ncbi:tol-pal system YbgF family protein [Mucilaginibacter sp.]|jgi:tetratricopeptide (TPR) repeat protein|uniref:tetratricopeptide repeat protein n=1 Tax=Mucilaginibacter sp. TaxID=1882438 RepID=UPI003566E988
MRVLFIQLAFFLLSSLIYASCKNKNTTASTILIKDMNLKRGEVALCGTTDQQLGSLEFEFSCNKEVKEDFALGLKLLHSFEYDEAEKTFAKIIYNHPECAMAFWGVAMSNFHPLWAPPTQSELKKGAKAVKIAQEISQKSDREERYINAIASFYDSWDKVDHRSRCIKFEKAMETLYAAYPNDNEAAIFYALSLTAAADPSDKSFTKQKKAGSILNNLYPNEPNHPGIIHYIIHTYDYPELAQLALPAARKYASVAPSSAHALHMPSHIFTRLGLWRESISSNIASVSSARCYAAAAGIKGHWDEELHGMDYLMYAYLQRGANDLAKKQWDYLNTIDEVNPINFKVAYAFAAIPSRYLLENRIWHEAANLKANDEHFSWTDFPWQKAIIQFTRLMGSINIGNIDSAKVELEELKKQHDELLKQKDIYKAGQIEIQIKTGEAWIWFKEGKNDEAIAQMNFAADLEDKTEKHPVTPGEVIPARELLGDMLMQMQKWDKAFEAYQTNLKKHPNRFNGLYGAAVAAENLGYFKKSKLYYTQLVRVVDQKNCRRAELEAAKQFIKEHPQL